MEGPRPENPVKPKSNFEIATDLVCENLRIPSLTMPDGNISKEAVNLFGEDVKEIIGLVSSVAGRFANNGAYEAVMERLIEKIRGARERRLNNELRELTESLRQLTTNDPQVIVIEEAGPPRKQRKPDIRLGDQEVLLGPGLFIPPPPRGPGRYSVRNANKAVMAEGTIFAK